MIFHKTLVNWYLENKRDLPWRKTKDPYLVWMSEIMLQQTRVIQGMAYFLKFSEAFPKVEDLANSSESQVLKMWQGLGYYSRARNLHFTAKYVANDLAGKFPNNYKDLLQLKGIGDYTASAIASICFDEATAVVDGNVYRVLARYFGIDTPINTNKGIKEFKLLAQSLIDKDQPGVYNQAIMDFGSMQCKPQKPSCHHCPLTNNCVAFEKQLTKNLPVKEKKIKVKKRFFNYLVLVTAEEKTILEERTGKGIWQGLYQFPLIESSEKLPLDHLLKLDKFQHLVPEGSKISLFNQYPIIHKLTHQHLDTQFWIVQTKSSTTANIHWKEASKYPVPVLISKFLDNFDYQSSQKI